MNLPSAVGELLAAFVTLQGGWIAWSSIKAPGHLAMWLLSPEKLRKLKTESRAKPPPTPGSDADVPPNVVGPVIEAKMFIHFTAYEKLKIQSALATLAIVITSGVILGWRWAAVNGVLAIAPAAFPIHNYIARDTANLVGSLFGLVSRWRDQDAGNCRTFCVGAHSSSLSVLYSVVCEEPPGP